MFVRMTDRTQVWRHRTGEIRFLTTSSANDVTPCFSPDGRSVYFASDRHRGYRFTTIYRVDVDVR